MASNEPKGGKPNPFSFLSDVNEGKEAIDPRNPYNFLGEMDPGMGVVPPDTETRTSRTVQGITKGIIHPVRAFLPEEHRRTIEEKDLGIAGAVGELIGAGATFVPLFKGASTVLKGVGLLRTGSVLGATPTFFTPFGRTGVAVRAAQVAKGSLAFAGFETFAGESVEEAPGRFVKGLAEGAAFEVAAMGAAAAWGGMRGPKKWRPSDPGVPEITVLAEAPKGLPSEVAIDPTSLKLFYQMRPGLEDSPEMVMAKMREIGTPDQQLAEQLLNVTEKFMPGGQVLIPGLNSKDMAEIIMSRGKRYTITSFKREGDDTFDLLMMDREREILKARNLGAKTTVTEMGAALLQRFDDLELEFPGTIPRGAPLGRYSEISPERVKALIQVATDSRSYKEGFGTASLLHEAVHHITYSAAVRNIGLKGVKAYGVDLLGLIKPNLNRISDSYKIANKPTVGEAVEVLRKEFRSATEEMVNIQLGGKSRISAMDIVEKSSYYRSDEEMISRMAELLLLDPKTAYGIAPNAAKLVSGLIKKEAPVLRELMSKESNVLLDAFDDVWRMVEGGDLTVFTKGSPVLEKNALKEFSRTGWAPGLRAMVDGKTYEYVAKAAGTKGKTAILRDLDTGIEFNTPFADLQRPLIQNVVTRNAEVKSAVGKMLDTRPKMIPINVTDLVEGGNSQVVRRAVIDTKDFEIINGSVREWVAGLPTEIQLKVSSNPTYAGMAIPELTGITGQNVKTYVKQAGLLSYILELIGKKGLVQNDEGMLNILVGLNNQKTSILKGNVIESPKFGAHIAGDAGDLIYSPAIDDILRMQLRESGVAEVDLPYFMDVAKSEFGSRLRKIVSVETQALDENVRMAQAELLPDGAMAGSDNASQAITRVGLETDRLPNGRIELRDSNSKTVLGEFKDQKDAAAFAREASIDPSAPDLGSFPGITGNGGHTPPPKMNDPVHPSPSAFDPKAKTSFISKLHDAQTLFFPMLSSLSQFAKTAERHGMGPAFSSVYEPTHKAFIEVQNQLGSVVRKTLGGKSFKTAFEDLHQVMLKGGIKQERHPIIQGYIEALSKEEIVKPGGLMARGMKAEEIAAGDFISSVGLGQDVPRLLSFDRLLTAAGKDNLGQAILRMEKMELSPEAQQVLAYFKSLPKGTSKAEIMNSAALSTEEKQVLKIIQDARGRKLDDFSIMAVSRYASAPKLKPGFKTGRDMFMVENQMTSAELKATKILEDIYESGFLDSGLDPKRHISGYFPHLRKWTKEGLMTDEGMAEFLPVDIAKWVGNRFRSGELNVYETDPMAAAYKHIRGLYMNKYFDPIMPDIKEALNAIKAVNPQDQSAYRIMNEYVLELMGKPHASFDKLQMKFDKLFKIFLGKDAPEDLARNMINGLVAATSMAAIPFRPMLIARNAGESLLKVPPRIGFKSYVDGLSYVTDPKTMKAAFREAQEAGAIRSGTTKLKSLHGAEEAFGPIGPQFPAALERFKYIFDKGFSWYQTPDDWGRAIAFHGQKFRFRKALDAYQKGGLSKKGLETLKADSKLNTFDPTIVRQVEKKILDGDFLGAENDMGLALAEETMVRYGYADHPVGWNSVVGRLFGQFGTWPVQYKDYVLQGLTRGSTKDKMEFAMIHSAVSGGIIAAGASVGLNLESWTGMGVYTGGPYADLSIDIVKSLSGSDLEKSLARRNLYGQLPILGWLSTGNPRSIFLPGSYAMGDWADGARALREDEGLFKAVMEGSGARVMRAGEKSPLELIYKF